MKAPALTIPEKVMERALKQAICETLSSLDLSGLPVLDADEAAQILRISAAHLRNLSRQGQITFTDFGARGMRWSVENLRKFAKEREIKSNGRIPA